MTKIFVKDIDWKAKHWHDTYKEATEQLDEKLGYNKIYTAQGGVFGIKEDGKPVLLFQNEAQKHYAEIKVSHKHVWEFSTDFLGWECSCGETRVVTAR